MTMAYPCSGRCDYCGGDDEDNCCGCRCHWQRGHDWRTEGEPRTGGQHVGVERRRFRCATCGTVTEYTRESMVRFLREQEPCGGGEAR